MNRNVAAEMKGTTPRRRPRGNFSADSAESPLRLDEAAYIRYPRPIVPISMSRRAIVLFTGKPRSEARQKSLPRRLLPILHAALAREIAASDAELILAADEGAAFVLSAGHDTRKVSVHSLGEKVSAGSTSHSIPASPPYSFWRGTSPALILRSSGGPSSGLTLGTR